MARRTQSQPIVEARLRYVCMSFGWFQALIDETSVADLSAAEAEIFDMLERGAMIAHAYRETDQEHPELVGRHRNFRSLQFEPADRAAPEPAATHEIERFLLDLESFQLWADALKHNAPIEQRWIVVDLWPFEQDQAECLYGRATLIPGALRSGLEQSPEMRGAAISAPQRWLEYR